MSLILLVETNSDLSAAVDLCESQPAWRVVRVRKMAEAVKLGCIDLILTDVMPSQADDNELLGAVRAAYLDIPLIAVADDDAASVRALAFGASSFVARNHLSRDLISTIERVLTVTGRRDRDQLCPHLVQCEQRFDLPCDSAVIAAANRHLRDTAEKVGLCRRFDLHRLSVALDEAFVNAVVHGNLEIRADISEDSDQDYREAIHERLQSPLGQRRIFVQATFTLDEVRIAIRDQGCGFKRSEVADPTAPENLDKPHGRGIMLMKVFMDEVRYNDLGNEVTLVKRIVCPTTAKGPET